LRIEQHVAGAARTSRARQKLRWPNPLQTHRVAMEKDLDSTLLYKSPVEPFSIISWSLLPDCTLSCMGLMSSRSGHATCPDRTGENPTNLAPALLWRRCYALLWVGVGEEGPPHRSASPAIHYGVSSTGSFNVMCTCSWRCIRCMNNLSCCSVGAAGTGWLFLMINTRGAGWYLRSLLLWLFQRARCSGLRRDGGRNGARKGG